MKRIFFLFTILYFAAITPALCQQITYSEVIKEDSRKINFEILGNFGGNYLIYKNINRKHYITVYDREMQIVDNVKLDFISEKTFNLDFVSYPDYFFIIYQYQKKNIIYCDAAKMSSTGQLIGQIINLDTTKTNLFANNKIYYLTNSEDRQKILLYKMQPKNDEISLTTKLFNSSLQILDSTRNLYPFNDRKETYDDLQVGNDGTFLFAKETGNGRNDYTRKLEINYRKPNTPSFISNEILLDDKYIEDVKIKIDNLNNQYIVNSFSYKKNFGNIEGLFTVIINSNDFAVTKKAITLFDDSIRTRLSDKTNWRTAFNDFAFRNVILKKDGGFLLTTEEYFTQTRNTRWNSRDYYYNPYNFTPGYYSFQRDYYGYYRDPYRNSNQDIIYNYNDILIFSFDKDLRPQWNNIINKKTSDLESDNFLSFSTMNLGAEIHYLFLQKDKNKQLISDHALQPGGQIKRYPTIKTGESGYDFMPRLAKQVGARQVIVPCTLRNNIAFAKIDFSNIL
ncbi:MAG: hypothetical protein ABJA37_10620 [Ferruginibacter sp.]